VPDPVDDPLRVLWTRARPPADTDGFVVYGPQDLVR
jgi:hypothetical protein